MRALMIALTLLGTSSGCSSGSAAGASVELAPAPLPGYTCFVIRDGGGAAVGGNCLKTDS